MQLVVFTSENCGPCTQLKRSIEQVSLPEGMTYREVDAEKSPQEAMRYSVRGLPTLIVTDGDGIPVQTRTGYMSVSALDRFIRGAVCMCGSRRA